MHIVLNTSNIVCFIYSSFSLYAACDFSLPVLNTSIADLITRK